MGIASLCASLSVLTKRSSEDRRVLAQDLLGQPEAKSLLLHSSILEHFSAVVFRMI